MIYDAQGSSIGEVRGVDSILSNLGGTESLAVNGFGSCAGIGGDVVVDGSTAGFFAGGHLGDMVLPNGSCSSSDGYTSGTSVYTNSGEYMGCGDSPIEAAALLYIFLPELKKQMEYQQAQDTKSSSSSTLAGAGAVAAGTAMATAANSFSPEHRASILKALRYIAIGIAAYLAFALLISFSVKAPAEFTMGTIIVSVIAVVAGQWKISEKLGLRPWTSAVPFLNAYELAVPAYWGNKRRAAVATVLIYASLIGLAFVIVRGFGIIVLDIARWLYVHMSASSMDALVAFGSSLGLGLSAEALVFALAFALSYALLSLVCLPGIVCAWRVCRYIAASFGSGGITAALIEAGAPIAFPILGFNKNLKARTDNVLTKYIPNPYPITRRVRMFVAAAIVLFFALGLTTVLDAAGGASGFIAYPESLEQNRSDASFTSAPFPAEPATVVSEMSREEYDAYSARMEEYSVANRKAETTLEMLLANIFLIAVVLSALVFALAAGPKKSWHEAWMSERSRQLYTNSASDEPLAVATAISSKDIRIG